MNIDYRGYAKRAVEHAKQELLTGDDVRLRSAALQLRMSMEALTYDRFRAYSDEVDPEEYATWQPKRIMQLLLDIDANADTDSSVSGGTQGVDGTPPKEMEFLGAEKVLNLSAIKKHYDALGSYLHMPTWKKMQEGTPIDLGKLRERCQIIISEVEKVLASPIWNIRFAIVSRASCVFCGKPMQKRCPEQGEYSKAKCFGCGAHYKLSPKGNNQVLWEPIQTKVTCPTDDCGHAFFLGDHKLERGANWVCPKCSQRFMIEFGIVPMQGSPS